MHGWVHMSNVLILSLREEGQWEGNFPQVRWGSECEWWSLNWGRRRDHPTLHTVVRAHARSFTSLPAGGTPRGTPDRKNPFRTILEPKSRLLWSRNRETHVNCGQIFAEWLVYTSEMCNPDFHSYFRGNIRGVCVVCLPFGPVGKQTTEVSHPRWETGAALGARLVLGLLVFIIHLGLTVFCC